jgi:hypothetical protein
MEYAYEAASALCRHLMAPPLRRYDQAAAVVQALHVFVAKLRERQTRFDGDECVGLFVFGVGESVYVCMWGWCLWAETGGGLAVSIYAQTPTSTHTHTPTPTLKKNTHTARSSSWRCPWTWWCASASASSTSTSSPRPSSASPPSASGCEAGPDYYRIHGR